MNSIDRTEQDLAAISAMYAVLQVGGCDLLIDQREVKLLEPMADVDVLNAPWVSTIGSIECEGKQLPVFQLSEQLEALIEIDPHARICVVLKGDGHPYGLACHNIQSVTIAAISIHDVPIPMRTPTSPIEGFTIIDEHLVCVSSADKLFRSIN